MTINHSSEPADNSVALVPREFLYYLDRYHYGFRDGICVFALSRQSRQGGS